MDGLDQELKELKGFIADLKSDRSDEKEKELSEGWTKYTSMSIVFIAVLAAIATQQAGKFAGRNLVELNNATLDQAQATDQWSYFQANSIKENLYQSIQELTPGEPGAGGDDAVKRRTAFKAKIDKYEAAKKQSKEGAESLERQRDAARKVATEASAHGAGMASATSIFQISIAMGSICLVTKKKWLWYVSLLLAALGTAKMALVVAG
jgi:hypothetical protein